MLLRYVQRNPVRGKLVKKSADWKFAAEHVRRHGPKELKALLSPWPVARPRGWDAWVDQSPEDAELKRIRECIRRSRPMGDAAWTRETADKMNLKWTLRPRGRPIQVDDAKE